jgi:hypothetical protein
MSDRVESSDDDVEDPSLNFELSWRNQGVAGGGNDDSAEEEDEEEEPQVVSISSLVGHTSGSLT